MKKNAIRFLLMPVFVLSLLLSISCARVIGNDDSTRAKQLANNENNKAIQAAISGVYEGKIQLFGQPEAVDARLFVFSEWVIDGVDSNGNTKSHPEPRAQLRFSEVGQYDDTNFKVHYDTITGDFVLSQMPAAAGGAGDSLGSQQACSVGRKDPRLQVSGTLLSGEITNGLLLSPGPVGAFSMKRVSSDASVPARDQGERLSQAYAEAVGVYGGRFTPAPGSGEPFPVKIVITMVNEANGGFESCPVLRGQYTRPDLSDPSYGMIALAVTFSPREKRLELRHAYSSNTGQPGHNHISVLADYDPTGFAGDMVWWNRAGRLAVKRCAGFEVDKKGACRSQR